MPSIFIPEWNTSAIQEQIKKEIAIYDQKYVYTNSRLLQPYASSPIVFHYPSLSTWRSVTSSGRLLLMWNNLHLAAVDVESFTDNCGIRSLVHFHICWNLSFIKLWATTVLSFINEAGYSLVLASDGPGGITKSTIEALDSSWVLIEPGINKRMSNSIYLWYKYITPTDIMPINWAQED